MFYGYYDTALVVTGGKSKYTVFEDESIFAYTTDTNARLVL